MLTAVWVYLALGAGFSGLKAIGSLAREKVGMGILHAAEAAFCGFAAVAVWGVAQ